MFGSSHFNTEKLEAPVQAAINDAEKRAQALPVGSENLKPTCVPHYLICPRRTRCGDRHYQPT